MRITVDGKYPVQDAFRTRENVYRLGLPHAPGLDQANSVLCPLGPAPTRAFLIMLGEHLDAMQDAHKDADGNGDGFEQEHTVTFDDGVNTPQVFRNLVFVRALPQTPGKEGDAKTAYVVEFGDFRRQLHNEHFSQLLNAQFNVFGANTGGAYWEYSRNTGTDWTWATMLETIWGQCGTGKLGTWPGLPAGLTPDGKPNNFQFVGVPAWLALCQALERINAAVSWDPTAATAWAAVVEVGEEDQAFERLLTDNAKYKLFGGEPKESYRGKLPRNLRIYFNKVHEHYGTEVTSSNTNAQWLKVPAYEDDEVLHASRGEDLRHAIWDDLLAVYDPVGVITSASATATAARALDRANAYRQQRDGGDLLHNIYTGVLPFRPGSQCKGVAWRQTADGGFVTEVVRHPFLYVEPSRAGRGWQALAGYGETVTTRQPSFVRTAPHYPWPEQLIKITGAKSGSVYPGAVQLTNPTTLAAPTALESVWVWDPGNATLGTNDFVMGHVLGRYDNGGDARPVYAVAERLTTCIEVPDEIGCDGTDPVITSTFKARVFAGPACP